MPILDETLLRDLKEHLRDHRHRDSLEADLWPGKTPGHSKISYTYDFRPKGFYRNILNRRAPRSGWKVISSTNSATPSPRSRWNPDC